MDFVFVVEMAGFQHGDSPFYLKRVTVAPVRNGQPSTFTFDTMFLTDEYPRARATFNYQTRYIHGISMDDPGIPYALRSEAIITAVKQHIFPRLHDIPEEYQFAPRILFLAKGNEKKGMLEALIPAKHFFINRIVRDLSDYDCPSAQNLLGGRRSTEVTALAFSEWFLERVSTPNISDQDRQLEDKDDSEWW